MTTYELEIRFEYPVTWNKPVQNFTESFPAKSHKEAKIIANRRFQELCESIYTIGKIICLKCVRASDQKQIEYLTASRLLDKGHYTEPVYASDPPPADLSQPTYPLCPRCGVETWDAGDFYRCPNYHCDVDFVTRLGEIHTVTKEIIAAASQRETPPAIICPDCGAMLTLDINTDTFMCFTDICLVLFVDKFGHTERINKADPVPYEKSDRQTDRQTDNEEYQPDHSFIVVTTAPPPPPPIYCISCASTMTKSSLSDDYLCENQDCRVISYNPVTGKLR